ncbi:hypothetical protein L3X38_023386 [Prunus dulcis]|uniref:Uncharacterized protein n=1 Tax=Prunus dulcis TaxID=3755 RepID=A0AAD4W0C5_PRUDU|nr:hypothetical protein L3X38_023386 [Prunus dulcis]
MEKNVSIPLCNVVDKPKPCTLELHHFGLLENGVYKGGKVCYVDNCIHDYLSLLDLKKIGIDLGYKVDKTQRVTNLKVYCKGPAKSGRHVVNKVVNDSCIPGLASDQVLVLYYHDPTHNNELESEDEEQEQHSEDVGNEEEEQEKEDVIVDSDYELSEEENATWEILDDDEDSDRLPFDGEEDGQKKTSKRKWKMPNFKQFRKETDLRNPEFRIRMQFANKDELKEAIREYAIVQGRNVKLVKNDNKRIQAKFVDKISKNLEWDVGAFQSEVLKKYHMNVSRHQIYTAKSLSKVIIEERYVEQYARLWGYAEELKKANKGSTVIIKNKMKDLKIENGKAWVFMSDKQKGLIPAIETLLLTAEHRICVRHLYSNFRTEHASLALKIILWAAARATTIP